MVAVDNATGVLAPVTLGSYFVLIILWVGMWYPPWTVVALSPVMVCAYLAPLFLERHARPGCAGGFLVLSVVVLAGEMIARFTDRVRRAEVSRERLLSDLSRENLTDQLTGVGNRRLGEMLLDSLAPGDAVRFLTSISSSK